MRLVAASLLLAALLAPASVGRATDTSIDRRWRIVHQSDAVRGTPIAASPEPATEQHVVPSPSSSPAPPPGGAPVHLSGVFRQIDGDGDGLLERDELIGWVQESIGGDA